MKTQWKYGLLAALGLVIQVVCAGEPLVPVPLPQVMERGGEVGMRLSEETAIYYNTQTSAFAATWLAESLRPASGLALPVKQGGPGGLSGVYFLQDERVEHKEGYRLEARGDQVAIRASGAGGFFYGAQTLRQLLPGEVFGKNRTSVDLMVPEVRIEDQPVYEWRGIMLDVSRYFLTKEYVKRYIDLMAMHKMNVLHWHLIDDCGWRIEIKKYPKLTEVGAWRGKGEQRHGGFYSQEDIKEIVAYAAERNVTVVPEIEIPAHTLSALAAYPELGCLGKRFEVPTRHSISPEIYCVGKETTWQFLEDVMEEVAELFPAKFVHIGGDEARYQRWEKCPHCQARKKAEGLDTSQQLQGWATARIEKVLEKHDKQIIGWAEILECGVSGKAGIINLANISSAL